MNQCLMKFLAALLLLLTPVLAMAQSYPARSITFLTPFPPGGGTDLQPIGRLITGAGKAAEFDKGFHQEHGMAVFARPVGAEPARELGQQMTGEVRHADPR